jgi:ligand-binding sensor domain-containing protein
MLIVLCNTVMSLSQTTPLIFERFSDDQGLPNNLFRYMLQDKQGIIWMGGGDGLACYDGYTATSLRHNNADTNSISGNNLLALYEDSKGRLWISSFNGLDVSDIYKSSFHHVPLSDTADFSMQLVRHITEDSLGNIWLAMDTSIIILMECRDGSFVRTTVNAFLGDITVCSGLSRPTAIFTDSIGKVWIGTASGLHMYDPVNSKLYCPDALSGSPKSEIQDIGNDRMGRIWVSCHSVDTRLYYSDPVTVNFLPFNGIPFEQPPQDIQFAFDLDNRLWAAVFTEQMYGYDFRDSSVFLKSSVNSNIRSERFLRNPFVDHSGNVWIPMEGYLIYHYPKGFRNYLHPFTFHQSLTCIYGIDEIMWLGYREEGLIRLNTKTGESSLFSSQGVAPRSLSENRITKILKSRKGNIIVVGFGNIDILDQDGLLIARHVIPGTNRDALEDSKGRLWIGGISGLHRFSEEDGLLKTYKLNLIVNDTRQFIQAISEDANGNIWFGSGIHGLGMLDPETEEITHFFPVTGDFQSLPTGTIMDMAIEGNMLWIATDVALVRFDIETHHIKSYNKSHGLLSDYIISLVVGQDGTIWNASNQGIAAFDPDTERFVNYGPEDGLLNRNYHMKSRYQAPDGTIYFGGENGLDFFHPLQLRKNPLPPRMYLSGITIDNKKTFSAIDLKSKGSLTLSYTDDHIEIGFFGLHFAAQDKVRNFYRLEGMHDQWIEIGNQRNVVFSDLSPGDYVFHGKAISPDGVWSTNDLVVPIHIVPPFYEKLWFRLLSVFVVAGILFGYMKYRERRIQQKERKEAEVARTITELEKRALQAQMNPHFIYNCMNSIQQFMILHDFEGAMRYLTRFSRLLRTVLNMSAQHRIALSDEIKLIEDYLELENMRFPNKFSYSIEVSTDLDIHTAEIPPFFIQPQVENAIRHGLINKSSPGHLIVKIDKVDQQMRIIVEDNGIGRESAMAAKMKDHLIHESKGLTIVKERLAHLHSENGDYPFQITDLYDSGGKAAGTRVEITLPIE